LIFARLSGLVYFIIFPSRNLKCIFNKFRSLGGIHIALLFRMACAQFSKFLLVIFVHIELLGGRENLSSAHTHTHTASCGCLDTFLFEVRWIFPRPSQQRENVAVALPGSSQSLNRSRSFPNLQNACCVCVCVLGIGLLFYNSTHTLWLLVFLSFLFAEWEEQWGKHTAFRPRRFSRFSSRSLAICLFLCGTAQQLPKCAFPFGYLPLDSTRCSASAPIDILLAVVDPNLPVAYWTSCCMPTKCQLFLGFYLYTSLLYAVQNQCEIRC